MDRSYPREFRAVLLQRARAMRKEAAPAEEKLWKLLRGRQLDGFKFRRQHRIGNYIADFYCHEVRLVVELDGDSHGDPQAEAYDSRRTKKIERDGCRVIRFVNDDVFKFTDEVLEEIWQLCDARRSERPSP
jgi:very-short-patch-repair endonuclease